MKPNPTTLSSYSSSRAGQKGSVLIILLWISFGLVSLALYFANTMSMEMRSADNQAAAVEAQQASDGALRYVTNLLGSLEEAGLPLDPDTFRCEEIPVGDAHFWVLGRGDQDGQAEEPTFGLIDESSKLNLNTVTPIMLEGLPWMTPEFAASIVDWRDSDSDTTQGGAEDDYYLRLDPPYRCKNASFESVMELRLVCGGTWDVLFGEDPNLNGVLDLNENDGDATAPPDNRDGRLDSGILDYLTVFSREPTTLADGTARANVASTNLASVATILEAKLDSSRANTIVRQAGAGGTASRSVLEFYIRGQMTLSELELVEGSLVSSTNYVDGLVNVNTASEAVLSVIPGIGVDNAKALITRRRSMSQTELRSVGWVTEVLDQAAAIQAGPYLTGRSYQYTADIVTLGHFGRGYTRIRYVIDLSEGGPKVLFRQDLTHLGWALGPKIRKEVLLTSQTR